MSRHMIFEETDNLNAGWGKGLFLALAMENIPVFGGPIAGSKGFLKITPTLNGEPVDFTCNASSFNITIESGQGSVDIALAGDKAVIIKGSGIGL